MLRERERETGSVEESHGEKSAFISVARMGSSVPGTIANLQLCCAVNEVGREGRKFGGEESKREIAKPISARGLSKRLKNHRKTQLPPTAVRAVGGRL